MSICSLFDYFRNRMRVKTILRIMLIGYALLACGPCPERDARDLADMYHQMQESVKQLLLADGASEKERLQMVVFKKEQAFGAKQQEYQRRHADSLSWTKFMEAYLQAIRKNNQ